MKKLIQKAQFGKIIKREKEVEKTPEGKDVYKSTYNRLTGRTKVVEKNIEYKNKNNSTPRTVYKNTIIVKRDNDKNWKSEKDTKILKKDGKLVKKNVEYTTYKKGGSVPTWSRKEGKNHSGGLNAKGAASYRRESLGSKLKMAVTTKSSKLKTGSKNPKSKMRLARKK